MLSRSFGFIAATALGAGAFLIPAGITPPEGLTNVAVSIIDPKNQVVQLPCSACAFSYKDAQKSDKGPQSEEADDLFWIQGSANSVLLNFTVSDDQVLELNGQAIYPLNILTNEISSVSVEQVPASAQLEDIKNGAIRTTPLEVTSAGVMVSGEEELTPEGDVLIPLTYSIFGLENQDMPLDQVSINLLRVAEGDLFILDVDIVPGQQPAFESLPFDFDEDNKHSKEASDDFFGVPSFPPRPAFKEGAAPPVVSKGCGGLPAPLCNIKNLIESKISSFGQPPMKKGPGCGGRKGHKLPSHIKPAFLHPEVHGKEDDMPPPFEGRPHHFRPHHGRGRHHHHHRHSFMHAVARGFAAVLIPTLAGVAVGMTVSLIGLLVGRLVTFFWIKCYRGGQRGYASVASDECTLEDGEMSDKKIAYVDEPESEALPVYEAAPAYDDSVKSQQ